MKCNVLLKGDTIWVAKRSHWKYFIIDEGVETRHLAVLNNVVILKCFILISPLLLELSISGAVKRLSLMLENRH